MNDCINVYFCKCNIQDVNTCKNNLTVLSTLTSKSYLQNIHKSPIKLIFIANSTPVLIGVNRSLYQARSYWCK